MNHTKEHYTKTKIEDLQERYIDEDDDNLKNETTQELTNATTSGAVLSLTVAKWKWKSKRQSHTRPGKHKIHCVSRKFVFPFGSSVYEYHLAHLHINTILVYVQVYTYVLYWLKQKGKTRQNTRE